MKAFHPLLIASLATAVLVAGCTADDDESADSGDELNGNIDVTENETGNTTTNTSTNTTGTGAGG